MANDCSNYVTLEHNDTSVITSLVNSVENGELLSVICPNGDWGTKWERNVQLLDNTDNSIFVMLDTAWSPPIDAYKFAESIGYTVDAKFCEFGAEFCGTYSTEEGLEEYTWAGYEDAKENVPEDLLEFFDFGLEYEEPEWDDDE